MICKIQAPNPNIRSAVEYNEKKMNGDAGIREHDSDPEALIIENSHVLATRGLPEGRSLTEEFERLRLLNLKVSRRRKVDNPTFHMSVNPGEDDRKLTEQEVVALIDEIMAGIGYKDQPYRIYKHTDIAREHYHVVSTRIGASDGQKINDSFERMVLRRHLRELAPKYGFSVIEGEYEKEKKGKTQGPARTADGKERKAAKDEKKDEAKKTYIPAFDNGRKGAAPTTVQMQAAFDDAMQWSFTTFEQFQALLLRRYRVLAEVRRGEGDEDRISMAGVDKKGNVITAPINEEIIGRECAALLRRKIESTNMKNRKYQRKRIEDLAEAAAKESSSYEDFVDKMNRKGVIVVVSFDREGRPFGVTWLDRVTKCAWKGSETDRTMGWLKQTAERKGWTISKDIFSDVAARRAGAPSVKPGLSVPQRVDSGSGRGGRASVANTLRKAENVFRKGAYTGTASSASAASGKKRDIFDEIEDEKLRKEAAENSVER